MKKLRKFSSIVLLVVFLLQALSLLGISAKENYSNDEQNAVKEKKPSTAVEELSTMRSDLEVKILKNALLGEPSKELLMEIKQSLGNIRLKAVEVSKDHKLKELKRFQTNFDDKDNKEELNTETTLQEKQNLLVEVEVVSETNIIIGDGSKDNPYQIWTPEELNNVRNNLSANYIQMADIDLSGYDNWEPIGDYNSASNPFSGSYDGRNFKITNLNINKPDTNFIGLFGYVVANDSNLSIKNINIENANINGADYVGSLIGTLDTSKSGVNIIIDNCNATGTVMGNNDIGGLIGYITDNIDSIKTIKNSSASVQVISNEFSESAGGLIGAVFSNLSIINSFASGDVIGFDNVGGLIGRTWGNSIVDSYASGKVKGNMQVGGLIGEGETLIKDCKAFGSVEGVEYVGGLVGSLYSNQIESSNATGNVSGSITVGGLIGQSFAIVNDTYATGSVSGDSDIGGLVGVSYNDTTKSYSTGSISGQNTVGGFIGTGYGNIDSCYAIGNVTAVGDRIGGFAGEYYGDNIYDSSAKGIVSGNLSVGGFAGYAAGITIRKCYASGNTTGVENIGGFLGESYSKIYNSYSLGAVTGEISTGGFIGTSPTEIYNCYSIGSVTGSEYTGGFIGNLQYMDNPIIFNCYYNYETSGQFSEDLYYGIPKTTLQMKDITSYESWNFEDMWDIDFNKNNGYPFFKELVYPVPILIYEYDDSGQLIKINNNATPLIRYNYDENGNQLNEEKLIQ